MYHRARISRNMVKGATEAIIGVTQDPSLAPLIMFGLGGIYVELMKDVAFRLHPLTDFDAKKLIGSIRMKKLFEGIRARHRLIPRLWRDCCEGPQR